MGDLFLFPLVIKGGRVFDASGADITEAYHSYQYQKAADLLLEAFEQLALVKQAGIETRNMLYMDLAYHTVAIVETFLGDNLTERLQLPYAGKVRVNDQGKWVLDKVNRLILPIVSLADMYRLVSEYNITIEQAEMIWEYRHARFYILHPLKYEETVQPKHHA